MTRFSWTLLAPLAAVLLVGCNPEPEITRYTVPKETSVTKTAAAPATGAPQQLVGAIFTAGDTGWFFKGMDDPAKIAPVLETLKTFLASARFTSAGEATWTLPEGWTQQPASGLRYATLRMGPGDDAPELSVTKLGGPEAGDETAYVASNVNRWLGQIGLPEMTPAEIAKNTEEITAGDQTGTFVNFTGKSTGAASMMAPFAGGSAAPPPSLAADSGSAEDSDAPAAPFKYKAPEGWEDEGGSGFRKASFKVREGDKLLDISVSDLAAAGGELLLNVNRWRGQVGLKDITQQELDESAKPIEFADVKGHYVELIGPKQDDGSQKTILGVVAIRGPQSWFVKAIGDADLAEREKAHFDELVESIQFE